MNMKTDSNNFREKLAIFLFLSLILCAVLLPLAIAPIENNKYVDFALIFMYFLILIVIIFLSDSVLDMVFKKDTWSEKIKSFIVLILIYFFVALILSLGVYGTLSSFFEKNISLTFPEYGNYLIPAFSLSMLFAYRILYFTTDKYKPDVITYNYTLFAQSTISCYGIKKFLKSTIIGTLFFSFTITFLTDTGLTTISTNVPEFLSFTLQASIFVAIFEEMILFIMMNLPKNFIPESVNEHSKKNEETSLKFQNFMKQHPYFFMGLVIILVIIGSFTMDNWEPADADCYNTTVMEFFVEEIDSSITETSINGTHVLIPIVHINEKEALLTERSERLIDNNLVNSTFTGRALVVSTKKTNIPLFLTPSKNSINKSTELIDLSNVLTDFPTDYDVPIIYSMYKSGHDNFYGISSFNDMATVVSAHKYYFDKNSDTVIWIEVYGGTVQVMSYDVGIKSSNNSNNKIIYNILEFEKNKGNIRIFDNDSIDFSIFKCYSGLSFNNS